MNHETVFYGRYNKRLNAYNPADLYLEKITINI